MKAVDATAICILVLFLMFMLTLMSFQPEQNVTVLGNVGKVHATGLNVWWNSNQTNQCAHIDWGILEPGQNRTETVYVESQSNTDSTLTITTSNWIPGNATNHLTFSASPNNTVLRPNQILQVQLSLTVSSDTRDLADFSFDITITTQ